MKRRIKDNAFIYILLIMTFGFTQCQKSDSSLAFGNSTIFIPQSTQSGGISLNYNVPKSATDTGYIKYSTFQIDSTNNKVNVFLGVSRSGIADYKSYTVNIATRSDTISQLITGGIISTTKPVVLLPASAYSLPTSVTVPEGSYEATYNLSIDKTILKSYAGKIVALCVVISNPTVYTLSNFNNQVIVIINVDYLKL